MNVPLLIRSTSRSSTSSADSRLMTSTEAELMSSTEAELMTSTEAESTENDDEVNVVGVRMTRSRWAQKDEVCSKHTVCSFDTFFTRR